MDSLQNSIEKQLRMALQFCLCFLGRRSVASEYAKLATEAQSKAESNGWSACCRFMQRYSRMPLFPSDEDVTCIELGMAEDGGELIVGGGLRQDISFEKISRTEWGGAVASRLSDRASYGPEIAMFGRYTYAVKVTAKCVLYSDMEREYDIIFDDNFALMGIYLDKELLTADAITTSDLFRFYVRELFWRNGFPTER